MEITIETPPDFQINGPDSPSTIPQLSDHDDLRADFESLRESYLSLQSKSAETEETLTVLRCERDEAVNHSSDLTKLVDEISREREPLRGKINELEASLKEKEDEFAKKLEEEVRKTEELKNEVEVSRERVMELETEIKERSDYLSKSWDSFRSAKESLMRIIESIDEEKVETTGVEERELASVESELGEEIMEMTRLVSEAEAKVSEYKEMRKKEKRELDNSVVSLTEENRDINTLLRIALVEKEAVEKSLNKLKGNNDQKRVAILQIAERGLQRVGFGFMMGGGSGEHQLESSGVSTSAGSQKSDSSECEEEVVSLVCEASLNLCSEFGIGYFCLIYLTEALNFKIYCFVAVFFLGN